MSRTQQRAFNGGTLVISNVPTGQDDEGSNLIARYVQDLNDYQVIGDIDVSYPELHAKYA